MDNKLNRHSFWKIFRAYCGQVLFDKQKPVFFNPFIFRRNYLIKLLEYCWQLDYEVETCRFQLESYWQMASLLPTQ